MKTGHWDETAIAAVKREAREMYDLYVGELALEILENGTRELPQAWSAFWLEYLCAEVESRVLGSIGDPCLTVESGQTGSSQSGPRNGN